AGSPAPATAPAVPDDTDPAGTADPPAGSPAGSPADGDASLPAPGSGPAPGEADGRAPDAGAAESTVTAPAPAPADETAPAPADGGAPGEDAAPDAGIPDGSAADAPAAGENAAPAPADGEPQPAPGDGEEQHAVADEAAVLLRELAAAVTQATEVLAGGDAAAALAAVNITCATAVTQSRRLLKAAATGRKPRGTGTPARPGQLRDLVAAHLAANPLAEFSPHAIGRVLGRSSGAVAH